MKAMGTPVRRTAGQGPGRKAKGQGAGRSAKGQAASGRSALRRRAGLCVALLALWALGGCGGGVSGEIGRACMAGGREAASPALCSCVQGVANQSLSGSDQKKAARFFESPQLAQEVRQSNHPGDESFWRRYSAFADRAEALCS